MTTAQLQFDAALAQIYDETRPIDPAVCQECFRDALREIVGKADARILDVGCGTGRILECLVPDLVKNEQVIGIDISHPMLERAKTKAKLQGVAFEEISVEDFARKVENHQCFDVVICHWCFHCIRDWRAAFRACTSLAKKNGVLIWMQEDGDLYQALDGITDNSQQTLHHLFKAYYKVVNRTQEEAGSQQIVPSSRVGTVLRCTDILEGELAKWGWEVQKPWKVRYWEHPVTVKWIIDKVLTPRVFTNLHGISAELNEQAIRKIRDEIALGKLPDENKSVTLKFWAKPVIACAGTSQTMVPTNWLLKQWAKIRGFGLWLFRGPSAQRIEARLRACAGKPKFFMPLASLVSIIAVVGLFLMVLNEKGFWHNLGEGVFHGFSLLLAVIGFFYAIYAIKGILERPQDLDEVLKRAANLLTQYSQKEHYSALMLCEYPAWGALSFLGAKAYDEYLKSFKAFLTEGARRQFVLVAPNFEEMENRITIYAQDYVRSSGEIDAAKSANKRLYVGLENYTNNSPAYFKHWPVDEVPRYQMLLIGEEYTKGDGELDLLPIEAIVWFAPRSSDVRNSTGRQNPGWLWTETEVPVFAWQITDRHILKELYECARFYVHHGCGIPCFTYKQLLGREV